MHRVILAAPPGVLADHRDGDGLHNRRSNLRLASHAGNSQNRRSPACSTPAGVREINGRFFARIQAGGRSVALGGYATPDEAHAAYAAAAHRIYGAWAPYTLPKE